MVAFLDIVMEGSGWRSGSDQIDLLLIDVAIDITPVPIKNLKWSSTIIMEISYS